VELQSFGQLYSSKAIILFTFDATFSILTKWLVIPKDNKQPQGLPNGIMFL
jgi:hypothetical protein